jgi:hypothetical protein
MLVLVLGRVTLALVVVCMGLGILWRAGPIIRSLKWRAGILCSGLLLTAALATCTFLFSGPVVQSFLAAIKGQ